MNRIYVTLQPQREVLCDKDGNLIKDLTGNYMYQVKSYLGYAAIFDPTKEKCEKKNRQQEVWAELQWDNDILMKSTGYDYQNKMFILISLPPDIAPKILDNIPLSGFKIFSTVSRSSTNNKLWRISDPRGFELEISTANMEDILMKGSVVKGELIGDFIWDFGKNGIGKAYLKGV